MNIKQQMDHIYAKLSTEEIPWNLERPPDLLLEIVESGRILPCRAIDLGCGAGNYAVWLATKGFQMTGVDISVKALELAEQLAREKGVSCRFVAADLVEKDFALETSFDFAYDWELLHHIFPENRERYIANVHRILVKGARYFSFCFSENDPAFGGKGKYRKTPLGTTLYFSSEKELEDLFEPLFDVEELHSVEISGKYGPHMGIKALLKKKNTADD
jgi:SAM-dependent methyltransferase